MSTDTKRMADAEFAALGEVAFPYEYGDKIQPLYAETARARQREANLERELAQAREALEVSRRAHRTALKTIECMSVFPPEHAFAGRELQWHREAREALMAIDAALTPTAREAAAEPKERECDWCGGDHSKDAAPPKPTDGGETP